MGIASRIAEYDREISRSVLPCSEKPQLLILLKAITLLGAGPFWVPVYTAAFFLLTEQRPLVFAVIIAECLQVPSIILLRLLTRRQRPDVAAAGHYLSQWNRYSFPSLHTARVSMLCTVISSAYPSTLPIMLAAAFLVGGSRLLLQKHFLSDIVAGALVGIAAAGIVLSV